MKDCSPEVAQIGHITTLLQAIEDGVDGKMDELYALVYPNLKEMARRKMVRVPGGSLQPTELVHEAFIRLVDRPGASLQNRRHFYFVTSRAMLDILIEHARKRKAQKRGGNRRRVSMQQIMNLVQSSAEDLDIVKRALESLDHEDRSISQIVRFHCILGFTREETAKVMSMSPATISRKWKVARARLKRKLVQLTETACNINTKQVCSSSDGSNVV